MIIKDKKIIFIKIPKTGSTTIFSQIWNFYKMSRLTKNNNVINLNFLDESFLQNWHIEFSRIESYLNFDLNDYKIFSIIRNPLQRLESVYRWNKEKNLNDKKFYSFNKFIESFLENKIFDKNTELHLKNQTYWLKNNKKEIDKKIILLNFDNFNLNCEFLSKQFNFKISSNFSVNKSKKFDVKLDEDLLNELKRYYKEDFQLFKENKIKKFL